MLVKGMCMLFIKMDVASTKSFFIFKNYPKLKAGSRIVVHKKI